jgi:hypothetical protein
MYSAFGSFYIPSCIMVFVYIKIYYAARERARRNIKVKRKSRRKSNRATAAATPASGSASAPACVHNNNHNAGAMQRSLAASPSTAAAHPPSAMKGHNDPSPRLVEKRTRFTFSDSEVALCAKEERSVLLPKRKENDDGERTAQKQHPPHPKGKKMVHILSAVSVTVNDTPLSLCNR